MESNGYDNKRDYNQIPTSSTTILPTTTYRLVKSSDGNEETIVSISPQTTNSANSSDANPLGCYFSDGKRIIDYVLVYDLPDPNSPADILLPFIDEEDLEKQKNKRRNAYENNLQKMGLELEYVDGIHSNVKFVLIHAPFRLLTKQAELLRMKMPVKQNDIKEQINLLEGSIWNRFLLHRVLLKKFRYYFNFNEKIRKRTNPPDYFCQPFIEQHLDCFINHENPDEFFSKAQRSLMVYDLLIRTRYHTIDRNTSDDECFGIERLINNGSYSSYYPLHDEIDYTNHVYDLETCSTRKLLYEIWVRPKNVFKYQPLHTIKSYFGTKIGFYFAWLGFYTRHLYGISLLGIFFFFFGFIGHFYDTPSNQICDKTNPKGGQMLVCPLCDKYCDFNNFYQSCFYSKIAFVFDNFGTVIFAGIVCVWITLFLEGWKRYHAELAYKWNVFDFEATDEVLRPEFQFSRKKPTRLNPVTQQYEPYLPMPEKAFRFICSGASVLFFITLIIALVIGVALYRLSVLAVFYRYFEDQGNGFKTKATLITSVTAAIINLILILIMDEVYYRWALKLTEWEVPRTQSDFDDSFIFKVFAFEFVNYYSSLFYIAFVKGSYIFGYREQCDPTGCMVELVIQLFIIMTGNQLINAFTETFFPIILNWVRLNSRLKLPETRKQRLLRQRQESRKLFETKGVSFAERDYALTPVTEQFLFIEYLEMVIQFGFCTLFVSALPLAPFFALMNNILEIRLDAYKFIVNQRKPVPSSARSIGIWFTILDLLSNLAVLCNAFLVAFTSDFVPRVLHYLLNGDLEDYLDDSMAYVDARNITVLGGSFHSGVTVCRQKVYRHFPCSLSNDSVASLTGDCNNTYTHNLYWWMLLSSRLIFVIVFVIIVFTIKAIFSYWIPDIPTKIVIQLQRERYLARQAILCGTDENCSHQPEHDDELKDTNEVAYQMGREAMRGLNPEPSLALKHLYSHQKRPALSPSSHTPPPIYLSSPSRNELKFFPPPE